MQSRSDENYLRFNEKSNTYDSLEKISFFLFQTNYSPSFWKWVIIALHSGLYGAMILSLCGSNYDRVVKLPIKNKKNYTLNDRGEPIAIELEDRKLLSFPESFKRIQNPKYMKIYINSKVFVPRHSHCEAVEWINNELRNQFLHFIPQELSIGIEGIKEVFKNCLEIIEFCLFQSGNVLLNDKERELFENILREIRNHNKMLRENIGNENQRNSSKINNC